MPPMAMAMAVAVAERDTAAISYSISKHLVYPAAVQGTGWPTHRLLSGNIVILLYYSDSCLEQGSVYAGILLFIYFWRHAQSHDVMTINNNRRWTAYNI